MAPLTQIARCGKLLVGRVANDRSALRTMAVRCFASFSMDSLKALRSQSGAPIVECKKALQNTDGSLEAAMDWLREHGAAKASSKLQGRETTQGLIGLKVGSDLKSASLVKLASETDFAALSPRFVDLVLNVTDAALSQDGNGQLSSETMLQASSDGGNVQTLMDEAIVAIRENISIKYAEKFETSQDDSILVGYVHNRVEAKDAGLAAAVIELAPASPGALEQEMLFDIGRRLAMHVVAARPTYLSSSDVPESEVKKEKDLLANQMADSGKPPEIIEKIVTGRLGKYYEQVCLEEQAHLIEDSSPKIKKFLKEASVSVIRFGLMFIAK